MQAEPRDWRLQLALASLLFDSNAYAQSVQKSADFSENRDEAFYQFQRAAEFYAEVAPTLVKAKQTTDVYELWFYAALGACDLGKISEENVADVKQYPLIREAIQSLPGELAEFHLADFANNLFTRMSPIKPQVKFRYLQGGFEIVGEHRRAWEARSIFEYYQDLVTEIQLDVAIDGSDRVGYSEPFGMYVNLLHTVEIERESGGFAKYLQNQNSQAYAFNYGRPTEDYREKFEDSVNQILGEHFDVLSITFESPQTIQSRPSGKEGWRLTPYAYILLKPRGPEVDKVPSIKLDLDFLDTSGYAVLPIQSAAIPIDASDKFGDPRPYSDLKVVQTLDERQANEGKLILEVKATANGLVPRLEDVIEVKNADFEVVSEDTQPVLPSSFDGESDDIVIISERSWTIKYSAKPNDQPPTEFQFCDVKVDEATATFQRYDDADLVTVSNLVKLERNYGKRSYSWIAWVVTAVVALGLFLFAGITFAMRRPRQKVQRFEYPDEVNPFTVLGLLKRIRHEDGVREKEHGELDQSIERLEDYYFGRTNGHAAPDLEEITTTWLKRAH